MKKMDVVFPLKNVSKYGDDLELRFTLRSLDCQPWVNNIYLIGHSPDWCNNVIHIPLPDPYPPDNKDANIINKILLACSIPKITTTFVVNSDDQVLLKEVGEEDLCPKMKDDDEPCMVYLKNRRVHPAITGSGNLWYRRVGATVDWCEANGYPTWIVRSHTPYIVRKDKYCWAMSHAPCGQSPGLLTHVYFNLTMDKTPEYAPEGYGVRIKKKVSEEHIELLLKGATHLNFNDRGFEENLITWLERRFPDKSRWEE